MAAQPDALRAVVEHLHPRREHRVPGDARLRDRHRLRQRGHDRRRDAPAVRRHARAPATATARPATRRSTRSPSGSRSTSTTRAGSSGRRSTTSRRAQRDERPARATDRAGHGGGQAVDAEERDASSKDHRVRRPGWASRSTAARRRAGSRRWRPRRPAATIEVDVDSGVYGHRVTMPDLEPADLARFRRMATDRRASPTGRRASTTALALSGSAAQSKIQRVPRRRRLLRARPHPARDPRGGRRRSWATCIRDKALATLSGPSYRLWEVKSGTHDRARRTARQAVHAGSADLVDAGGGRGRADAGARRPMGRRAPITWDEAPGRARLVQARLGRRGPRAGHPGQRLERARPDLGGAGRHRSCRSTGSSTRTSRRSTSRPIRSRCSRGSSSELSARRGRRLRRRSSSTRSGSTPSRSPTTARPRAGCTTCSG